MSSLVSDFLINPVLRQARRFSRSNTPTDLRESNVQAVAPQPVPENGRDEVIIEDGIRDDIGQESSDIMRPTNADNTSRVSSDFAPIREGGDMESELNNTGSAVSHALRSANGPAQLESSELPSLLPDSSQVLGGDDDSPNVQPQMQNDAIEMSRGNLIGSVNNAAMSLVESSIGQSVQLSTSPLGGNGQNTNFLPADDGMGPLRQRIIYIQSMDVGAEQKARLMHQLLTQDYTRAHKLFHEKTGVPITDPATLISQERPSAAGTLSSFIWQMNGALDPAPAADNHTFHLSPNDLKRTYAPPDLPEVDDPSDESESAEDPIPILGCNHYKRNVKLQCSTCERWYTCRLCHDEAEDHVLIRHETKNMLCMICGCAQRAGEFCVACGERTAWYYCGVCKLWDNDANKNIYHCNDCGICRKGRGLGKDFFHCKTCGVCMDMSVMHDHKCIERVSDCDCPICGEYMFTSPKPVVFMSCGHSIHAACYVEHMHTSYKCPICSKSLITMETQFRNLDRAIDQQPMPPQFQNTLAMVLCNDCQAKSAVKYHWLGLKCAICASYNTAQLSILRDPASEVTASVAGEADSVVPGQEPRDMPSSTHLAPGARSRRHSSHVISSSSHGESDRLSPYPLPSRLGRSVSPSRGLGPFANDPVAVGGSDGSGDEDDLDFWGRKEPRNPKMSKDKPEGSSAADEENEYENDSTDSDSENDDDDMDDDDDDDDGEEEPFALFGHR